MSTHCISRRNKKDIYLDSGLILRYESNFIIISKILDNKILTDTGCFEIPSEIPSGF